MKEWVAGSGQRIVRRRRRPVWPARRRPGFAREPGQNPPVWVGNVAPAAWS